MIFTSNKCPNCGAPLPLKENQKQVWCEYCGSQFLVEKDEKDQQRELERERERQRELERERERELEREREKERERQREQERQRQKELERQREQERERELERERERARKASESTFSYDYQEKAAKASETQKEASEEELKSFERGRKKLFILPFLFLALYFLYRSQFSAFFFFLIFCVLIGLTKEKKPKLQKQYQDYQRNRSMRQNSQSYPRQGKWKNKWVSFFLCLFLGFWGFHKFYEGKFFMGLLYLFTWGLFGIGWLIDLILLLIKPNPYQVR